MSWLSRVLDGWGTSNESAGSTPARGDPARILEVSTLLETLRPYLAADGGDVKLVAIDDGLVTLAFVGACRSCTASTETVSALIEPRLRERCSWVTGIHIES